MGAEQAFGLFKYIRLGHISTISTLKREGLRLPFLANY